MQRLNQGQLKERFRLMMDEWGMPQFHRLIESRDLTRLEWQNEIYIKSEKARREWVDYGR